MTCVFVSAVTESFRWPTNRATRPSFGLAGGGRLILRFSIRYHASGRRVYETAGLERDGCTEAEAHELLADRLAAVRLGLWRDPDAELPAPGEPKPVPLFADFARAWVTG
jgi:hypothetical protein